MKAQVKSTAKSIVDEAKEKGRAALYSSKELDARYMCTFEWGLYSTVINHRSIDSQSTESVLVRLKVVDFLYSLIRTGLTSRFRIDRTIFANGNR